MDRVSKGEGRQAMMGLLLRCFAMLGSKVLLVVIFTLCVLSVHAQFQLEAELRGTYLDRYKAILPGVAAAVTGKLTQRVGWKVETAFYVPRSGRLSYMTGPRTLAFSSDTNLRRIEGRYRKGLIGMASGIHGTFSRTRTARGMLWEALITLDDLTYWSTGTASYVHTGEVRPWRVRSHSFLLGSRMLLGYRTPLGEGRLRVVVFATPIALEFRSGQNRSRALPFVGAGVGYQWAGGR